jgi:VanZ family protein
MIKPMGAKNQSRFRRAAKICGILAILFLAFIALCPSDWVPRTDLGFELDHFLAFFIVTGIVCLAWPRPFLIGAILIVLGVLLEALQLLTPDRSANVLGAIYSTLGTVAAALFAELVIRFRRRTQTVEDK